MKGSTMILISGSWVKLHSQYSTDKSEVKLVRKGIITVKCRNKPSDFSDALLGLKVKQMLKCSRLYNPVPSILIHRE